MRVTTFLIVVNVVLYLAMLIFGRRFGPYDFLVFGAQYGPLVSQGQWFRIVTALFVHGGILHIAFNMYALYQLGYIIEMVYGEWKMLIIYFISGIAGNIATQFFYYNSLSVGASGAIFGLAGAIFITGYKEETAYYMKSLAMGVLPMIIINVIYGFIPGSHINNAAHIGGLIAGILLGKIIPAGGYSYHIPISETIRRIFRKDFWTNPWYQSQRKEVIWFLIGMAFVVLAVVSFIYLIIYDIIMFSS
ncbi:MAG: rhomboid family intramembrane serine protease [Thermotogaceae bacterium]|nr:rhomboid family intramembrane serine protease [Thermotogaceae bacterium]